MKRREMREGPVLTAVEVAGKIPAEKEEVHTALQVYHRCLGQGKVIGESASLGVFVELGGSIGRAEGGNRRRGRRGERRVQSSYQPICTVDVE